MKKYILLICALILSFVDLAMAQDTKELKTLIVYYSKTGNTASIANKIQNKIGGDIFEIKTVNDYPDDYKETTKIAKKELDEGYLPPIKSNVENIEQYDVIFIGSPIWWGSLASPVKSFLSQNDLSGKKVVAFVTHGGGGKSKAIDDLAGLCKGCIVEENAWSNYGKFDIGLSGWINKVINEQNKDIKIDNTKNID